MAKAIALTRSLHAAIDPVEALRAAIVIGSALALIFAGQAAPL